MSLKFKEGVQAGPLHPAIDHAFNIIDIIWDKHFHGVVPIITSLREGTHSVGSLHFGGPLGDTRCRACDIRSRNITKHEKTVAITQLRLYLGQAYDIVDEYSHIHVEYDPF